LTRGGCRPTSPPCGWGGSIASGRKREGGWPATPPYDSPIRPVLAIDEEPGTRPVPAPHTPAKGVTPTQRWVGTLSVNERPGPLHNPGLGSVLSENLNASQETGVRQRGGDPARDGIPVHRNSIGRCNRQIVFLCNIKSKIWYTTPPCVSPVLRKASRRIMDWF